jgi:hypothetical protein
MQRIITSFMLGCICFFSLSLASENEKLLITSQTSNKEDSNKERLLKKTEIHDLIFNMGNFEEAEEYLEKCAQLGPLPDIIVEDSSTQDLSGLLKQLDKLFKNGIKPENILVILDLHGTITIERSHLCNKKLRAKEGVIDQLKLIKEKYQIQPFLCSSWSSFPDILQDINNLGMNDLFNVKNKTGEFKDLEKYSIHGYQEGYVVSAKFRKTKNIYFKRKGLAPLFYSKDCYKKITHVLFADDSAHNLSYLTDDFLQYRPAPLLKEIYLLSTSVIEEDDE